MIQVHLIWDRNIAMLDRTFKESAMAIAPSDEKVLSFRLRCLRFGLDFTAIASAVIPS